MSTLFILLTAILFLFFGVWFVLFPSPALLFSINESLQTTSGNIDVRAVYGGMSLGIARILATLAKHPSTHKLGLQSIASLMLCMAGGRAIGIALDGDPNSLMITYLIVELITAAIAFMLIQREH